MKDHKLLIDLEEVVNQKGLNIYGVIHVGAHEAEEYDLYKRIGAKNIVFIEANPILYDRLKQKFKDHTDVKVINAVVYNKIQKMKFKIHNDTHTSSILDMDFIAESHPELYVESEIEVETTTMDKLIEDHNLDIKLYNFISYDVQGVELEAIEGTVNNLKHIDYIYTEVETKNLYVGGKNYDTISKLMSENNYELVTEHIRHWFWGDCLFAKRH